MSRITPGQSGKDPEREAWLKQFKGLPEGSAEDELFTDRVAREPVAKRRADAVTIEGEIEAVGEFARGVKQKLVDDREVDTDRHKHTKPILAVMVVLPVLIAIMLLVIFTFIV
jgi:hypothetical protein